MKQELSGAITNEKPLYPIGIVAELIGIKDQTLRLYEKHGLIRPARKNKTRYYSENDIKWLRCLRSLIHNKKISIEGIKKLLDFAACWEIKECSEEQRAECSAFIDKKRPCWELNRKICNIETVQICEDCVVYMSRNIRKN